MPFRNDRLPPPDGDSEESTQPAIQSPELRGGERLSTDPPAPPALPPQPKLAMPPPLPVSPSLPKPPPLPRRETSSPAIAAPRAPAPPSVPPPISPTAPTSPGTTSPGTTSSGTTSSGTARAVGSVSPPAYPSKGPVTQSYTVPRPALGGSAPPPGRPPTQVYGTQSPKGAAIPPAQPLPTIPGPATPVPSTAVPRAPAAPQLTPMHTPSSTSLPLPKEPTITKNLQLKPQEQTGSWRPPSSSITGSSGSVRPGSIPPGPLPPAGVEERVQRLSTQVSAARESIERHDNDVKALRSRLELADARLGELEEEVRGTDTRSKSIDTLAVRIQELETLAEKVRAGDQALRKMLENKEKQAEERKGRLSTLEDRTAKIEERLESLEKTLAARLERIEKALQSGPPPADDLRRIKGIGPKYERMLHEMGIRSFAQIAAWTPEDVERIADKLGARVERIERDGWIPNAKKLAG